MPCLRQTDQGTEVAIFVQPRASKNQVVGLQGEELKVRLTAPPVDGAANLACLAYLAKLCSVPKSRVRLLAGEASRHKRLLLEGVSLQTVEGLLQDLTGG